MRLDRTNTEAYARGATVLGTGGGGDPHIGRLLLDQALGPHGFIELQSLADVADEALVATVASLGAPTVMLERLLGFAEGQRALDALERQLGRPVTAIISAEIGGMNAVYPLAIAAKRGLPVIDADGMGRAFPELQMVSFNLHDCSAAPLVLTGEAGDVVVIDGDDNVRLENLARPISIAMGGMCVLAGYAMTGPVVRRAAIPGTLTIALSIGLAIEEARRLGANPVVATVEALRATPLYPNARALGEGRIADIDRKVLGGYTAGLAQIASLDGRARRTLTFRNEFLRLSDADGVIATAPDLIILLDSVTGEPITTEAMKYGQRVSIIGADAAPVFRSPKGLEVCGPAAFGFDDIYQPFELTAERRKSAPTN